MPHPMRWLSGLAALLVLPLTATSGDDTTAVTTQRLEAIAQPIVRSAPAEVVALAQTAVAARLAAPLERLHVGVGDRVTQGEVVAELECVDARHRLDRAQARLNELEARQRLARTRLERTRRLHKQDAASDDRLDEARAEFDTVTANLHGQEVRVTTARRDVERCTIEAPFAGVVTRRPGQPGGYVQAGTPVVELVDPDAIALSARLHERDVTTLRTAQKVRFTAGDTTYPAELTHILPLADSTSRTREARLRFTGAAPPPGKAGRLQWQAVARAVPPDLIVRRGGRLGVMLIDEGQARFHALASAVEGRPAPTELPTDTRVIVTGRYWVSHDAPVRVTE